MAKKKKKKSGSSTFSGFFEWLFPKTNCPTSVEVFNCLIKNEMEIRRINVKLKTQEKDQERQKEVYLLMLMRNSLNFNTEELEKIDRVIESKLKIKNT